MSPPNFQAAIRLNKLMMSAFLWSISGAKEVLLKRFEPHGLVKNRKMAENAFRHFMLELHKDLKGLSDDKALAYIHEVEQILAQSQEGKHTLQNHIDQYMVELSVEAKNSTVGLSCESLAWQRIHNILKRSDHPFTPKSRFTIGVYFTIATGALDYLQQAIQEIERHRSVLQPYRNHKEALPSLLRPATSSEPLEEVLDDLFLPLLQNNFTTPRLDKLVYNCGLIAAVDDRTTEVEGAAPWKWVIVFELLGKARLLNTENKAALHRAVKNRYGRVCGLRILQSGYIPNEKTSAFNALVNRLLTAK